MDGTLSETARTLRRVAAMLADAGTRLPAVDPGAAAFGIGGVGRLADLGQDLSVQWQFALQARAREAAEHAARLEEIGDAVARAGGRYAEVEDTVPIRDAAWRDAARYDIRHDTGRHDTTRHLYPEVS